MIFNKEKFLLIAGPCALESEAICRKVAESLVQLQSKYPVLNIVYSGSFDKANRTSLSSQRGPGLEEGLRLLSMIKKDYGFRVSTDLHEPSQAPVLAKVCDVLQIPAFLCRQTDLLVAAADSECVVSVKKGQFLSPYDMRYVIDKLFQVKAKEVWQIERGTTFGYNNLVVDMRSIPIMKENKCPVIFDATHSVQLPGGGSGESSGQREFIECLSKAACAAGCSGLYVETHPDPKTAISDKDTQLSLGQLDTYLEGVLMHAEGIKSALLR